MTPFEEFRMKLHAELRDDKLKEAALEGLEAANSFFIEFGDILEMLNEEKWAEAKAFAHEFLIECWRRDPHAWNEIYKGQPYLWLGRATFMLEDYESAVFFYDAAAREDLRLHCHPTSHSTLAFNFLTLEGYDPKNPATKTIDYAYVMVNEVLQYYTTPKNISDSETSLSMDKLRVRMLRPAIESEDEGIRSIATSLLTFCFEWHYRNSLIEIVNKLGTLEPFFLHLYKGCLLFESLLKNQNMAPPIGPKPNLGTMLNQREIQGYLKIPQPSKEDFSADQFSVVLSELKTALGKKPLDMWTVIKLTAKTRNTLGHDLGQNLQTRSQPFEKNLYQELSRIIAASSFHAIARLYK